MSEYVCVRTCRHDRLYRVGERVECEESDLPRNKEGKLNHFRPVEEKRRPGRPKADEALKGTGGMEVIVNDKTVRK